MATPAARGVADPIRAGVADDPAQAGPGDGSPCRGHMRVMTLPPAKPKLTAEERRRRDADRLQTIRLRMLVGQALHDRGITTLAGIGAAIDMRHAAARRKRRV